MRTTRSIPALLACLALLSDLGCTSVDPQDRPTYPVELRLGGALPEGGMVGDYSVTLTEAWVVLGDWTLYGMDREAAGYAFLLDGALKHAGHAHGEADVEAAVTGSWAIDLLGEPTTLARQELTEGHYFDGSIRLRPCTETYAPMFPDTGDAVATSHDLWGHSLLLRGEARLAGDAATTFEIVVDAEAMLAGLEYGGTVMEGGATRITTRLDLGKLLADLDFAALADGDGHVQLDVHSEGDAYLALKVRLQDPTLYFHEEAEATPPQ